MTKYRDAECPRCGAYGGFSCYECTPMTDNNPIEPVQPIETIQNALINARGYAAYRCKAPRPAAPAPGIAEAYESAACLAEALRREGSGNCDYNDGWYACAVAIADGLRDIANEVKND